MGRAANWPMAAELTQRIEGLIGKLRDRPVAALAGELDAIRRIANANANPCAAMLVHALEGAVARGERGVGVTGGIDLLHDAIRSGGEDGRARRAIAAAWANRFSG